ncbi:MAG: hypothetical protein K0U13_04165 [Chlamydiae bacterium]|nr:hypothetical protein [Chlamydiota bacterium]
MLLCFRKPFNRTPFDISHYKENVKLLWRCHSIGQLRATSSGRLSFGFSLSRRRVKRAIHNTFLAMEVEFLNPVSKKIFARYLDRKLSYLRRLSRHLKMEKELEPTLLDYKRSSLLQMHIIEQMHQACVEAKEPAVVKQAQEGLEAGIYPLLIAKGRSGSYLMRSKEQEILGVFKPYDEEAFAINNPARSGEFAPLGAQKLRHGVCVGEGAHNEVAAYLVDAFFGFGIVPRTYYASFTHHAFFSLRETDYAKPKIKYGSFQEYIEGFVLVPHLPEGVMEELSLDLYQTLLFFDLIVGNSDRHLNNLLIGEDHLAAIDHALCFSEEAVKLSPAIWSLFKQSEEPFHPQIKKRANDFPFDELCWKLQKRCYRSVKSMQRLRERVEFFRALINADLVPKQMIKLLTVENCEKLTHGVDPNSLLVD